MAYFFSVGDKGRGGGKSIDTEEISHCKRGRALNRVGVLFSSSPYFFIPLTHHVFYFCFPFLFFLDHAGFLSGVPQRWDVFLIGFLVKGRHGFSHSNGSGRFWVALFFSLFSPFYYCSLSSHSIGCLLSRFITDK